jgi:integrase
LRSHIDEFGLGPGGRLFVGERNKDELPILTINRIWRQGRAAVFTPEVAGSPLTETPYDLRHAAVSTWLNAGISPTQVAEWAGQSTEVLGETTPNVWTVGRRGYDGDLKKSMASTELDVREGIVVMAPTTD